MKLTKRMQEVLRAADLERGEINDVPLGTMYGLASRKLIPETWRMAGGAAFSTAGRRFPEFSVKLTAEGVRAARTLQGLRADL